MVQSESFRNKDISFGEGDNVFYKNNSSERRQGHQGKTFMRKKVAEAKGQEPSTICIGSNNQLKHSGSRTNSGIDEGIDHGFLSWNSFRKKPNGNSDFESGDFALYDNEPVHNFLAPYISGYTTPGPREREASKQKKANLGVMLGVYLPTIQHILGVTMFIRLFWVVGIAGVWHTMLLLFLCCTCTLLTCISLSAVATNGVVEGGGAYFMISRNLGSEFGSAVGILFYLANTVATSMYLVGGVEVFLLYICPVLTIGGEEVHSDTGMFGMMSNNYRIYGTLLLLIECVIVALGVRFVQLLAPVSLLCVILSILACFAGGIEKSVSYNGQHVCMLEDHLLSSRVLNIPHDEDIVNICNYCKKGDYIANEFCKGNVTTEVCQTYTEGNLRCVNAFPGFNSLVFTQNMESFYLQAGQAIKREKVADKAREVYQDVTTSFFLLLAIYFPAVTGIMTGANMSGDLKDPQKSIPSGTVAATLTTSFIYYALTILFSASIIGPVLRDKNGKSLDGSLVVASLSWPYPWVVIVGSFLSTFGAALQCLCNNVIPMLSPFARVTKNNEPFLGLLITTFIAELAILLGAVDAIAEILDFFFLMCYAFVNLICALHSLMGAPNWRPRFKYYHWSLSFAGAFLCFFIMFASCWYYALIACALTATIYKYVQWKGAKKEWGDGIRGLALTTAQYSLMQISEKDPHPKNWRPQLLILHSMPWSKELVDVRYLNLLNFAAQMKAGKGLTMVVSFLRGNPSDEEDIKAAQHVKARMENDMQQLRLRGFAKTLLYDEDQIAGSVNALIQSIGIGGLKPNTLLLSWPTREPAEDEVIDSEYQTFTDKLLAGAFSGMALVVAKGITDFPNNVKLSGHLDVYWIVRDGGLCLLITFLLRQSKVWRHCKIRIIAVARQQENNTKLKQQLQTYVYQLRIDAEILVTELSDPELSKTAFERTLLMEERSRMLKQMQRRGIANRQLNEAEGDSDDRTPPNSSIRAEEESSSSNDFSQKEEQPIENNDEIVDKITDNDEGGDKQNQKGSTHYLPRQSSLPFTEADGEKQKRLKALDRKKVHKMHGAIRLNELILEHSNESQLVLFSLPKPPLHKDDVDDYIHYLEVISDKLQRVLFVRGTGSEVITTSS